MHALDNGPHRRQSASELWLFVRRDLALPVAATTFAAILLLPAPPVVAWYALLAVPAILGSRVGRRCGFAAACAAGLLYLWAFNRPRFAAAVTDHSTIRLGFLLGIAGALGAYLADSHRRA
jgi:hypothetical protein